MKLTNNTLLITGGATGIGLALALGFHSRGNRVILAGRTETKLKDACSKHPGLEHVVLDVSDGLAIERSVPALLQRFPTLNGVIHSAGIMKPENLGESPDTAVMEETVRTNLLGTLLLNAALLPHLLKQPHATIMTVSSGLAFIPLAKTPTYSATKAAIHSYTQSLRYQLRGTSVEVLELAPPYVQTHLMGEHQAQDPRAMPLDDFITEVFTVLESQPGAAEILVERVKPLRNAEKNPDYAGFFEKLNAQH